MQTEQPMSSGYEFTATENITIGNLASKMKLVSIFLIVIGALSGVANLVRGNAFSGLIYGGVFIFTGMWTINAAKSFREIVDTQGHDIPLLMKALENLFRVYTLQFWTILAAGVLIMISVGMVIGGMAGPRQF